ncbi:segregation and condensation protein B [Kribbella rubisoli]|uniref:Segregation and condensation protein B n=1 Tax=Kribbella rubisoli TaxID=3075929 RepID=A0A4Q7XF90_9ACTN|nr:segregation and condensation protein B [Kribbella rubisoli]
MTDQTNTPEPAPQEEPAPDQPVGAADSEQQVAPDGAVAEQAGTDADAVPDRPVGVGEDFAPDTGENTPQPADTQDEEHLPPGQTEVPVGDEVVVDDDTMRRAIEAILMVTDEPLPVLTLARAVGRPTGDVADALAGLAEEYTEQGRGFDLREVGGGWRYYTRAEAAPYVERFVLDGQQARLTQAALETLSVVAYKQPVSRARVSAIRGVNVDGVMRTLVARGLVEEAGADTESQATLYRTTTYFLERMGMQSLDDLPELAPYLPDMDDIEEELAAQTLPPSPSSDDTTSTDDAESAGMAEDAQSAQATESDEAEHAETEHAEPAQDAEEVASYQDADADESTDAEEAETAVSVEDAETAGDAGDDEDGEAAADDVEADDVDADDVDADDVEAEAVEAAEGFRVVGVLGEGGRDGG